METTVEQVEPIAVVRGAPPAGGVRRAIRWVGAFPDMLSSWLATVGGIALFSCALIILYDVVARYVFRSPTSWSIEVCVLLSLPGVFLVMAYGLQEGAHVRTEILVRVLPDSSKRLLEVLSFLVIAIVGAVYFVSYFKDTVDAISVGETTPYLKWPAWPVVAVVTLGMLALVLQAAKMLVVSVWKLVGINKGAPGTTHNVWNAVLTAVVFILLAGAAAYVALQVNVIAGVMALLVILIAAGLPISFSLVVASAVGLAALMSWDRSLAAIPQLTFNAWNSFSIVVLPLFIFAGNIMFRSGLAQDLFGFMRAWIGHVLGGVGLAALAACGVFAAISGSSVANAATIGLVAVPEMEKSGYSKRFAAGTIAAGGTLGVLIPPSGAFIILGILMDQSIAKLFMAGIVPGLVMLALLCVTAVIYSRRGGAVRLPKMTSKERLKVTKSASLTLLMPVIVLGGIYTGIFTPTEAAAVSCVYALVLAVFLRKMRWSVLMATIKDSTKVVAMIGVILGGATALSKMIVMTGVAESLANAVISASLPNWAVVAAMVGAVLVLGCFLDGTAMAFLTIPVFYPVILSLGLDPIWFAVLWVVAADVGALTPPVGMNLFVLQQIAKIDLMEVVRGTIPFMVALLLGILILALVPILSTWLPSMM